MGAARGRGRVEPTEDWGQRDYELIRPMVLFGSPAAGRARETGAASERTLQRRARRFETACAIAETGHGCGVNVTPSWLRSPK